MPTEVELRMDDEARELRAWIEKMPAPKAPSRWDCRQYDLVQLPDGSVEFVFDEESWELCVLIDDAIERMLAEHEATR